MTAPLHQWSKHAGTTIKWLSPDSEEAYNKHLANTEHARLLNLFGWVDVDIEYTFNSEGFRVDEFDSRSNWMAIGCSFTQGTGVNVQDRWTTAVSQEIKLHCWNLGIAGAAGDTCFRVAKHYVPKLLPKFVVYLEPRYNRTEIISSQSHAPLVLNWAYDYKNWSGTYIKELLLNEENLNLAAEKNREAIRSICLQHNIPLIVYAPDAYCTLIRDEKQIDLGRDLLHPGRLNNRAFAQVVAKDVEKLC
jgi:hypothetical protein